MRDNQSVIHWAKSQWALSHCTCFCRATVGTPNHQRTIKSDESKSQRPHSLGDLKTSNGWLNKAMRMPSRSRLDVLHWRER